MKYVKLRAKTYNEALMQLRMQYGNDVIPISHKYVKEGGILGGALFAKQVVELTAAYHEKTLKSKSGAALAGISERAPQAAPQKTQTQASPQRKHIDLRADGDVTPGFLASADDDYPSDDFLKTLTKTQNDGVYGANGRKLGARNESSSPVSAPRPSERSEKTSGDIILSRDEFNALKRFERDFNDLKTRMDRGDVSSPSRSVADQFIPSAEEMELAPYAEVLRKNDFEPEESDAIMGKVKSALSSDELRDSVKIQKTLKELIKSRIVVAPPVDAGNRRKIVMFVGPTGVGKTTSLAKLGAIFSLRESKSVAFVTIDTYRIAATEQLKKYADIMKIPVHVVNDTKEFKQVMETEKAQIILVDTSGRSHRNTMKISEIKSFADTVDCDFEKILCVSACTKKDDLDSIFSAFSRVEFDSVMITKTDESNSIGNVINVADKYSKPISYIANGQEVPNDIMQADADRIADMMVGGSSQF
jgi:flagellar biosynthesis protein FlhF